MQILLLGIVPNSNVQAELQAPSTIICSSESRSFANLFRYLSILPPGSSRIRIVAAAELIPSVPILTKINALIKALSFTAEPLPLLPLFAHRVHLAAIAAWAASHVYFPLTVPSFFPLAPVQLRTSSNHRPSRMS